MGSKARVYADANLRRGEEYWDYEKFNVPWRVSRGCVAALASRAAAVIAKPL